MSIPQEPALYNGDFAGAAAPATKTSTERSVMNMATYGYIRYAL